MQGGANKIQRPFAAEQAWCLSMEEQIGLSVLGGSSVQEKGGKPSGANMPSASPQVYQSSESLSSQARRKPLLLEVGGGRGSPPRFHPVHFSAAVVTEGLEGLQQGLGIPGCLLSLSAIRAGGKDGDQW